MYPITRATFDDAAAILALQKRAYESEARLYDDWSIPPLTQSLESLCQELTRSVALKCEREGTIVGSVRGTLNDGVCHIGRLIVEPAFQRRGIASALLAAIELEFPAARSFELFTGSRSADNIRLYERHGYQRTTTRVLSPQVTLVYLIKPGGSLRRPISCPDRRED